MSTIEMPSMDINVGLYGSGRMARGLLGQMISDQDSFSGPLVPHVVNFRSERDVTGFAVELMVDAVYGRSPVVVDASEREVNGDRILPKRFFERRVRVRSASGQERDIILTCGDNPTYTQWNTLGVGLVFDTTGDSSRDPREHTTEGGAELVVATYPNLKLPTFVGGVNDHKASIEREIEQGNTCFSASSCSTGAITTLLSTLLRAEVDVTAMTCEITHALTQSDAVIDSGRGHSAFHTKRNSSGSQREVTRIMQSMGYDIPFMADSTRVLEQVGSAITPTLFLRGSWTPEGIVDAMKEAIKAGNRERYIGVEERFAPDAGLVKGDKRTVVIDAGSVQTTNTANGDTICMIKGWFDNEAGYVANTLRLASGIVRARHARLVDEYKQATVTV